MSDENRINSGTESIADKLDSAKKALSDVDAVAKARREEEQRRAREREREERQREEAEKRAREKAEKENAAIMKKKQAELEYAENYRRRIREERARAEATERARREAERREAIATQNRQQAEEKRLAKEQEMLTEAAKRNQESDELVKQTSDRIKQKEVEAEALRERIRNATTQREKEEAEALLRSLESVGNEDNGLIVLHTEPEANTEVTASADLICDDSKAGIADADKARDQMRSAQLLKELEGRDAAEKARKIANDPINKLAADGKTEPKAATSEPTPENTGLHDASDDFTITLDIPTATLEAEEKTPPKKSEADIEKEAARAFLFARSTYDILTSEKSFGTEYEERMQKKEDTLSHYRTAGGGEVVKIRYEDESGYRYESATAHAEYDRSSADGKTKDESDIFAAEINERPSDKLIIDDSNDSKRIHELAVKKYELESKLLETETKSQKEIAELADKEHEAKKKALIAEYEAKERAYIEEINALDKRLKELQRKHDERKGELEGSILHYENKYTEITEDEKQREREAMEKHAAEVLNGEETKKLSSREPSKYLNRRDAEERRLLGKVNAKHRERTNAAKAKKDVISLLYEEIGLISELLSSYVISYKHTVVADHKRYARSYAGKVNSAARSYNACLGEWDNLTKQDSGRIGDSLPDIIKSGESVPPFPTVYMPDEAPNAASAADEERDLATAAGIISTEAEIKNLNEKELSAFLSKQAKLEADVRSRINSLNRKKNGSRNKETLSVLYELLRAKYELLQLHTVDYKAVILSGVARYKKPCKNNLNASATAYKKELEGWRSITESSVTLPPENIAQLIERGEDIPEYPLPMAPVAEKSDTPKETEANAEKEIADEAKRSSQATGVESMSERDLNAYLNRSMRKEGSLIRTVNSKRRAASRRSGIDSLALLRDCIDAEKELLMLYAEVYRAAFAAKSKHRRPLCKKLSDTLKKYNADLHAWRASTDTEVTPVPEDLVKLMEAGEEIPTVYSVILPDTAEKKEPEAEKYSKNKENAEKERIWREEAERERQKRDIGDKNAKSENAPAHKSRVDAAIMKYDLAVTEQKADYRTDKYSRHVEENEYRFGDTAKKEQRELDRKRSKLSDIRRGKRGLVNHTKAANATYLSAATMDLSKEKRLTGATLERALELQKRLEDLLIERDGINMRLASMYTEENTSGRRIRRRNHRSRIANARLAAIRGVNRKYKGTYRLVSGFRGITVAEKQKVYDAINKKMELSALIAENQYRKRHERPRGAARRKLNNEINEANKRMRDMDADIRYYLDKFGKRSSRAAKPGTQFAWLLLLLLIVAAGVMIYLFRDTIWGYITTLMSNLTQGSGS